jgi:2-methylisocitrate lyase-like PEP mutase family enzyme
MPKLIVAKVLKLEHPLVTPIAHDALIARLIKRAGSEFTSMRLFLFQQRPGDDS